MKNEETQTTTEKENFIKNLCKNEFQSTELNRRKYNLKLATENVIYFDILPLEQNMNLDQSLEFQQKNRSSSENNKNFYSENDTGKISRRPFEKYEKKYQYNWSGYKPDSSENNNVTENNNKKKGKEKESRGTGNLNIDISTNEIEDYDDNNDYLTIVDLHRNPNQYIRINSPHSLRAIYDTGCTLEELYYKPFNSYLEYHPEIMRYNKNEQIKRYNFYNQMRLNKIKDLCKYRQFLISEERQNNLKTNLNFNSINIFDQKSDNKRKSGNTNRMNDNIDELIRNQNIIDKSLNDLYNKNLLNNINYNH